MSLTSRLRDYLGVVADDMDLEVAVEHVPVVEVVIKAEEPQTAGAKPVTSPRTTRRRPFELSARTTAALGRMCHVPAHPSRAFDADLGELDRMVRELRAGLE